MKSSRHIRPWRLAFALLLGMSTLLAACGGSTNTPSGATAAPGGAATTTGGSATQGTTAPSTAATAGSAAETATTGSTGGTETATTAGTMAATTAATAMSTETATTAAMAGETVTAAAAGATATTAATGSGGAAAAPKLNKDVSGTIDFWHFWGSAVRRNAIRRVIAICNQALPNIKVNETFKPFGDIWTANTAAVAAGSGMPDVIVEDRP